MLDGQSAMLTGQAGSGKTHTLNEFIRLAKKQGKSVAVTATTGLAATHLGGSTIHSWSGMGVHDTLPANFFRDLPKGRRETIQKAGVLIVDEISMMHDFRLDMLDTITRTVREVDAPFGGLQVILCGDFFQLPPVNRDGELQGGFVVHSQAWRDLSPTICYLSEQHRQNDDGFLEILTALRGNDLRQRHAKALLDRIDAPLPGDQVVTELHTTNVNVDAINHAALLMLDGEEHNYPMFTTGKANYVDSLKRSCLAAETLALKKGAFVMFVKNSPEKKVVNGTLGVVEDFEEITGYPEVRLRNDRLVIASPETWELRDGDKKRASITQVPLRLAWAITVHKSQGMTLDAARIDLRRAFVEGMGYVALSRVRSLDTLSLAGINRMALKISDDALTIDQQLQTQSAQAEKLYSKLEKLAIKALKQKPAKNAEGKKAWAEKIEEMRKTYPNAFRPWPEAEDKKLLSLHKAGKGLEHLIKTFGRHPGSIQARLKKHLGDEVLIKP
jgi:ATP-dependent DNA helicase PIF1